ncbi:proton-coupled folate transporter-like [Amphiura filiformis]|uniref:proton-coupled folate transporter-like n=1 Tax=Amphiura filiformis TaxID=82378 RepID=UPI003B220CD3
MAPLSTPSPNNSAKECTAGTPTDKKPETYEQNGELTSKKCLPITVEPIVFFMMLCYGLLVPLKLQYLTERFSENYNLTYFDIDADNDRAFCSNYNNTTNDDIKDQIQQDTALWSMYLSAANALPAVFTTTMLGAYSDKAGRKIALILPGIGFTLYAAVYLVVIFLHLRIEYLLIGHFIMGISGDFTLLLTGCFSYMADITTKKERMFRIVILDFFGFVGAGISQIAIGFWINAQGFLPAFWFILSVVFTCTIYSSVMIKDTIHPEKRQGLSLKKTLQSVVSFFQNNSNNRRWRIILLLVILILRMVVFYSLPSLTLLYGLGVPFCWDSILVGFFSAGQYIIGAVGMLIGGKLLSKVFSEPTLMQLGFVSSMLSILLIALANTTIAFFFVILVGLFRALALPMVRSQMSKLAFPSEQGVMFACVGCMQGLMNFVSPLIFNTIFYATIKSEVTIVFYVMVGLLAIASLLTLILQIKQQDSSYMVLEDPREKDFLTRSLDKSYESSSGNVTTQRR